MNSTVTYPTITNSLRPQAASLSSYKESQYLLENHKIFIGVSIIAQRLYASNLKNIFEYYKERWINDTIFSSNSDEIINHFAYHKIISLGKDVVPFIVEDLIQNNNHWFYALEKILAFNPIKKENRGNVLQMKQDWIDYLANKYDGIENLTS